MASMTYTYHCSDCETEVDTTDVEVRVVVGGVEVTWTCANPACGYPNTLVDA